MRGTLAYPTAPKADFPFGVWDAFFWQEQKKAPQEARNPRGLHHLSPGGERDVEDAVPYGWVVCKPPQDCGIT